MMNVNICLWNLWHLCHKESEDNMEYKDVPVFIAHEDSSAVPSAVQAAIAASASQVTTNYKTADTNVKNWVTENFQGKE